MSRNPSDAAVKAWEKKPHDTGVVVYRGRGENDLVIKP